MSNHLDPSTYTLTERSLSIRLLKSLNVIYARIWHRVTVLSPAKLPTSGPVIVVSNHTSGLDPSLIQACCPRLIRWMMAKEFYDAPVTRRLYRQLGSISVARSGRDLAATRVALRALQSGHVLGIFPEGKIAPTRDLLPFQAGVALLAIKSGAPVYPVRLDGTQRGKEMGEALSRRQHATIRFGPEVQFDRLSTDKAALEEASERIRSAVEKLGS